MKSIAKRKNKKNFQKYESPNAEIILIEIGQNILGNSKESESPFYDIE